jgi:hypothetical protein
MMEKKATTMIYMDLRETYDLVWKAMHQQEEVERRSIGLGPYILNYIVRPMFEKRD